MQRVAQEFRRRSEPGRRFRFALAPETDITSAKDMEQDDARGVGEAGPHAAAPGRAGSDVDWGAIKDAFLYSGWSIKRICAKHGSTYGTIRHRAETDGWVRVVPMKSLRPGRPPRLPGMPKKKHATKAQRRRREMVERLFKVLDAKLREIEERMAISDSEAAPPQSAADRERDTRGLTALARLLAKVIELDDAAREKEAGTADKTTSAKETGQDADRLRQDLALRLKRLDQ